MYTEENRDNMYFEDYAVFLKSIRDLRKNANEGNMQKTWDSCDQGAWMAFVVASGPQADFINRNRLTLCVCEFIQPWLDSLSKWGGVNRPHKSISLLRRMATNDETVSITELQSAVDAGLDYAMKNSGCFYSLGDGVSVDAVAYIDYALYAAYLVHTSDNPIVVAKASSAIAVAVAFAANLSAPTMCFRGDPTYGEDEEEYYDESEFEARPGDEREYDDDKAHEQSQAAYDKAMKDFATVIRKYYPDSPEIEGTADVLHGRYPISPGLNLKEAYVQRPVGADDPI